MTNWQPITGWLPPLNVSQWLQEFNSYKQSPEYKKINIGMSLAEFKSIFWLEYIHRVAGRITGLVFLLPLIGFTFMGKINKALTKRLLMILLVGLSQGVIGWYMVKSGLKDKPHVSQYWLAFHLCTAYIIFSLLFLTALRQFYGKKKLFMGSSSVGKFSVFVTLALFVQIFMGGLVAGLNAGMIYNTYPLMDGLFIPTDIYTNPISIFEDVKTVQFNHRMMALFVSFLILVLWWKLRLTSLRDAASTMLFILIVQFTLGVLTLINVVPIHYASLHQVAALLLFSSLLYINYMTISTRK
jgi:cytochrome c oxidase assembly protein subunit 15